MINASEANRKIKSQIDARAGVERRIWMDCRILSGGKIYCFAGGGVIRVTQKASGKTSRARSRSGFKNVISPLHASALIILRGAAAILTRHHRLPASA